MSLASEKPVCDPAVDVVAIVSSIIFLVSFFVRCDLAVFLAIALIFSNSHNALSVQLLMSGDDSDENLKKGFAFLFISGFFAAVFAVTKKFQVWDSPDNSV